MKSLKKVIDLLITKIVDRVCGNGLMQEENSVDGETFFSDGVGEHILACGEESIVLLKNDGTLPLAENESVAVFGRCQYDWFYVGYGSGGDVHPPYKINLLDGLKNGGVNYYETLANLYTSWCKQPDNKANHGWWGHWPFCFEEMPLHDYVLRLIAETNRVAIAVIGRAAGEDRENKLEKGSFYLTDAERDMLDKLNRNFAKVVVILNCGNIIDMSWVNDYENVGAVLYVWQAGQESGNAVANVLSGKANPCGKLTDTIAASYEDYPSSKNFGNRDFNNYEEGIFVGYRYFSTFAADKVLYPFGFGLSYTDFAIKLVSFNCDGKKVSVKVKVTNVGKRAGKEVVQLYCRQAAGVLPKSDRVLFAFAKTPLLVAGESCSLTLTEDIYYCASYDADGATGNNSAYVLEKGEYSFLIGNSVNADVVAGSFAVAETRVLKQLEEICAPEAQNVFSELDGKAVPTRTVDLKKRITDSLPKEIPYVGDRGIKLYDVAAGRATLDDFVAQLNDKELEALTRGEGSMHSSLGVIGNGGAFGGILKSLRAKGIPPIITCDGPSGIRIRKYASLLPCGTALACTWNTDAIKKLFESLGREMLRNGVDIILGPGMNIHRNPLCGRNFEYLSEDPLVSGKIAAAITLGVQSNGLSACPKHFACNNQETNRNENDSRVSERALREIYLKGFEICVKDAAPKNMMASYNKINGVWSHYNYELATTVLRNEWGYKGNLMTDWWMKKSVSPEFPLLKDNAYRVRAQVDVLMPGNMGRVTRRYKSDGTLLKTLGKDGGITRGEIQRCAKNVLRFALTMPKLKK